MLFLVSNFLYLEIVVLCKLRVSPLYLQRERVYFYGAVAVLLQ